MPADDTPLAAARRALAPGDVHARDGDDQDGQDGDDPDDTRASTLRHAAASGTRPVVRRRASDGRGGLPAVRGGRGSQPAPAACRVS